MSPNESLPSRETHLALTPSRARPTAKFDSAPAIRSVRRKPGVIAPSSGSTRAIVSPTVSTPPGSGTAVADVEHDALQLRHRRDHGLAAEPADAARFAGVAAEGRAPVPVCGTLVDVDDAALESLGVAEGTAQAAGVNRAAEAVRALVCDPDHLVGVANGEHGCDRAEGLIGREQRVERDSVDDVRGIVEARREVVRAAAAGDDCGAARDGVGEVLVHLVRHG